MNPPRQSLPRRGERVGFSARQHWNQSFPFSCGPAALGSLLTGLGWKTTRSRPAEELALWREVTAVACPGSHPLGLALAAQRRGFDPEVRIDGPRPWLEKHVRSVHGFVRPKDYSRIERYLLQDCQELDIPIRWGSDRLPGAPAGLLLVTEHGGPGTQPDPHWIGLLTTGDGLWVTDPTRSRPYRSARTLAAWWAVSGFDGTKSWVGIERVGSIETDRSRSGVSRKSPAQSPTGEPPTKPLPGSSPPHRPPHGPVPREGPGDALPRRAWSRAEALAVLEPPSRRRDQDPAALWRRIRLDPGESLVDVGAGTGYFSIPAARRVGPRGRVYAVELSEELLALLQERKEHEKLDQLIPVPSTVTSIPLPTGIADVVLLANVLHDIPLSTVSEAVRLLKPTGRFVNIDWKPSGGPGGPPRKIRLSSSQATRLLARHGLGSVDRWDLGRSHYALTFRPVAKGQGRARRLNDGRRA
jgi:ubiquinone/menaquinone biosynthesis C-methylase UbiE